MNEKKNIDRLFQEKFKDFEVAPPDFVWENIQEALQEKKKRRVIPLWLRLSGVAAVLVIGSLLVIPDYTGIDKGDVPVVIEIGNPANPLNDNPVVKPANVNDPATATGDAATADPNSAVASGDTQNGTGSESDAAKGANAATPARTAHPVVDNRNNAVATQHDGTAGINKKTGKREKQNKATRSNEGVAYSEGTKNNGRNSIITDTNPKTTVTPQGAVTTDNAAAVADASQKTRNQQDNSSSANGQHTATDKSTAVTNDASNEQGVAAAGKNPADAASSQNGSNTVIDSDLPVRNAIAQTAIDTTKNAIEENELEKLYQEKLKGTKDDDKAVAENDKGKWNIKPQVAPLFYSSMTSGSPIDEQFAGNSKSYDNDLSYGLGIDYALNDRISIRSGINTVNLSYATNGVEFHASLNEQTGTLAGPGNNNFNVVINNGSGPDDPVSVIIDQQPTQTFNGAMVQKTGYIEVPLEMSYALVNKKFGIDVIGGVSTLFLNQNNVSVVSTQGYKSDVGEAQNLNNIHFSTNVGLGFTYKFLKSFQASFEPMLKYQVNTYSRDAGNFKPYFIGLYSGISFSF